MAEKDYVIGIDCSTTATKAVVWDARGREVAEGRKACLEEIIGTNPTL